MKKLLLNTAAALMLVALMASCSEDSPTSSFSDDFNFDNYENSVLCLDSIPMSELSDEEEAEIIFMREEEKLARDVYLTLYDVWGKKVFNNIAQSENQHMSSLLLLIERYDLNDPVGDNEIGEFTDPDLQALYDELVEFGSISLENALIVGGKIEEIDIIDLDEAIAATDNLDSQKIYESLLKGSENHLRAFVKNLSQINFDYSPYFLSQDQYNEIVD